MIHREVLRVLSAARPRPTLAGLPTACGCSRRPEPPEIVIGQDECDWCRMTIADPRLAAAFVPADGRPWRFGEPGCLLAWLAATGNVEGVAFVTAQEDAGWLKASSARFGRGVVRTPMSFDLAAWRGDPAGAPARLTWGQLLQEGAPHASKH